jgi:hypothetical protein
VVSKLWFIKSWGFAEEGAYIKASKNFCPTAFYFVTYIYIYAPTMVSLYAEGKPYVNLYIKAGSVHDLMGTQKYSYTIGK